MVYPHQRLSEHPHDRLHEHRKDQAWLDAAWADPDTRVVVVSGTRVRPRGGAIDWVPTDQAPDGLRVLLGRVDDRVWFAVITGPEAAQESERDWLPLRGLLALLEQGDARTPLLLHAVGLAEWHWVTRFCPRCGRPLTPRAAGHERVCEQGHVQFPRTDAAVIMLITDGEPGSAEERCLLGRQAVWPEGRFSTLAGFYEPGETLEDACRREVHEEVGVEVGEVTYVGNQPWPLPASLMIGLVGRAVTTDIHVDLDEIAEARWWTRAELRADAESGAVLLPGGISISHSLVEQWYGEPLPGRW